MTERKASPDETQDIEEKRETTLPPKSIRTGGLARSGLCRVSRRISNPHRQAARAFNKQSHTKEQPRQRRGSTIKRDD